MKHATSFTEEFHRMTNSGSYADDLHEIEIPGLVDDGVSETAPLAQLRELQRRIESLKQ